MARKNTFELQAKASVALAILGAFCTLAGAYFILDKFDFQNFWTPYNSRGLRPVAIGGALLAAVLAGGAGFLTAFLSVGQRLNKRNNLSWLGFFLSAAVIALALCCGVLFYLTRYPVEIKAATGAG